MEIKMQDSMNTGPVTSGQKMLVVIMFLVVSLVPAALAELVPNWDLNDSETDIAPWSAAGGSGFVDYTADNYFRAWGWNGAEDAGNPVQLDWSPHYIQQQDIGETFAADTVYTMEVVWRDQQGLDTANVKLYLFSLEDLTTEWVTATDHVVTVDVWQTATLTLDTAAMPGVVGDTICVLVRNMSSGANWLDITSISLLYDGEQGEGAGVTITESDDSTDVAEEGSTTDTYTVVLDTEPDDIVTITVDPDVDTEVNNNGSSNSIDLTFTTGDWDTAQTVTVKAIDDADVEGAGAHPSIITHIAASSGDEDYNGISIDDVVASVTDNDTSTGNSGLNIMNLPPTGGSNSTAGMQQVGPYVWQYDYTNQQIYDMRNHGIEGLRVCISVPTANDPDTLDKIAGYFDNTIAGGYITFVDCDETNTNPAWVFTDGKINDADDLAGAWALVHARFSMYDNVKYEIFNEPFWHVPPNSTAQEYVDLMNYVIAQAGLPIDKCIIEGLGCGDVQAIKDLWPGEMAYHVYSWWLGGGMKTQTQYSTQTQLFLKGVEDRTHVTEFGTVLTLGDIYETCTWATTPTGECVNVLRGIHDAVNSLDTPVLSMAVWHGYNCNDTYDFFGSFHSYGREKLKSIMHDEIQGECHPDLTVEGKNFFTQSYTGTRNNATCWIGYEFTLTKDIIIDGLGRSVSGTMDYPHDVKIWRVSDESVVAAITLEPDDPVDPLGYVQEGLESTVILYSGTTYRICSSEFAGGDSFRDIGYLSGNTGVASINIGVWGTGDYPNATYGSGQGYGPATFYYNELGNSDIYDDGKVNLIDFSKLGAKWLETGCGLCDGAELTGDGDVDIDDLFVLANDWLD